MLSTEFMCVFCTCTDYPHYTGIDKDHPIEINDDFPDPDEKWFTGKYQRIPVHDSLPLSRFSISF